MKGEITIFLSLVFLSVCALIMGLLESARMEAAAYYLQVATHSAMDSLFSQYHQKLWEDYRIFGLEYRAEEQVRQEYEEFLGYYLEQPNWYPFLAEDIQITQIKDLTEAGGDYFKQEILDYMKYGLWTGNGEAVYPADPDTMAKWLREARESGEVGRMMKTQAKAAVKLEKSIKTILNHLDNQKKLYEKAQNRLARQDGRGVTAAANELIRKLNQIPGLVLSYQNQADRLGREVDQLKEEYARKAAALSPPVRQSFEQELAQYQSYTDEQGPRRSAITALEAKAAAAARALEEVQEEVRRVEEQIAAWEPEDEEDELDVEALYQPVRELLDQVPVLSLDLEAGVKDQEKAGLLEKIQELTEMKLLTLVLPKGAVVNQESFDNSRFPSRAEPGGEGAKGSENLLEKAVIAEYGQAFFTDFCRPGEDCSYEMEYLLGGRTGQEANLDQAIKELLLVREGMNLIHLFSDPEKKSQAQTLALMITGAAGITPLVSVATFFIMGLWAFGEALEDVKMLLKGGKVALLKSAADWRLDLDNLLLIAQKGRLSDGGEPDSQGHGLTYSRYLAMLLMMQSQSLTLLRMLDMIQNNISKEEADFLLTQCAYQIELDGRFSGRHFFSAVNGRREYPFTLQTQRSY